MALFIVCVTVLTFINVVFALQLQRSLYKMRPPVVKAPAGELPSVSVCIPARNEMHAMEKCLDRVLASDYPKLEVIVFDDDSGDDTSILVRSYAHAGVRFVPGTELPPGWLGKNHALDILAHEASGSFIVFLDVDTAIQPQTITQLMDSMNLKKLDMLSVIPGRYDVWRASVLFSPLRYFWQLLLASKKKPPISSSIWIINRQTLLGKLGGFASYKDKVQPEASIAAQLSGAYGCFVNNDRLGVSYEKKWRSQAETSRRLLYPMSGGVWWKAVGALVVLFLLNVPVLMLLSGLFIGWTEVQVMGLWFLFVHMGLYGVYTSYVWRLNWWLGALLWPIVIMQELVLYIASVIGYARHTVTWKGRLVTSSTRDDHVVIDE